ncbi:MAG: hypothetical protein ABIO70_03510 [Pseudomonadota bacterium]
MGEAQGIVYEAEFNKAAKVEVSPGSLSEDPGGLILRDAAEKLDLLNRLRLLLDHRDQARITHPLVELALTRILLTALSRTTEDAQFYPSEFSR